LKKFFKIIFLFYFLLGCSKRLEKDNLKTLNLALSSEISTIDPANSYDGISGQIVYHVLDTLYEYDYEKRPFVLRPLLAEGFPIISKDKTKYTFKIKKGVLFHEDPCFKGKPRVLIAQDFINQIKRLAFLPIKSSGYWLFEGKIKGIDNFRKLAGSDFEKFKKLEIEGIKLVDENTFSIEFLKPYPQILYALSMSFTAPIPMEAIEFYKNDFSTNAIGTGPFFVTNMNIQGDSILTRNPSYHQKTPDFEKIHFHLIKEDQPRWLNFLNQKIDILSIPVDNYGNVIDKNGSLKEDLQKKGISLYKGPSFTYWWLSFNMKDPLVGKNKFLRLSIAHAINRKKLIELFTNGLGVIANSIIPLGIDGHFENSLPFTYDPDRARLLLKKAGFPGGRGLPPIKLDTRSTDTKSRQRAEFIKKELESIGIKITIQTNTFPAFLTKAKEGNFQFFFDGWTMDYPDAENSLSLLIKKNFPPGPNASFYHNIEFEKLYESYINSKPIPEKMMKMENLVNEDLPWIMLYYDQKAILVHSKVKNFIPPDFVNNYLKYLKHN
jgi:ABC-type transport system substrate-binding protein